MSKIKLNLNRLIGRSQVEDLCIELDFNFSINYETRGVGIYGNLNHQGISYFGIDIPLEDFNTKSFSELEFLDYLSKSLVSAEGKYGED